MGRRLDGYVVVIETEAEVCATVGSTLHSSCADHTIIIGDLLFRGRRIEIDIGDLESAGHRFSSSVAATASAS